MSQNVSRVRVAAAPLAIFGGLAALQAGVAGPADDRPAAWRVDVQHVGETLPSNWSHPAGQTIRQPYADPTSWVTVRVAFEVGNEADCPEHLFAFHAGRVGVDLAAPYMPLGVIHSNQAHGPQNVHLLTLQQPRCRLAIRMSKATRDGNDAWHRVAVWSQTGGPGPLPRQPEIDVSDPQALEAARQRATVEWRAWQKHMSEWRTPRKKAVMDEMRRRDPARAAAIEGGERPHAEFWTSGYTDRFWFADTVEPCFAASGYMVIGPSGLQLTYRPEFQRADPQAPPFDLEPLVPFSASITYDDVNATATLALYSQTCHFEIGIGEEMRTRFGWISVPLKRSF